MTEEQNKDLEATEKKPGKISLQEAMKQRLAQKKTEQASGKPSHNGKPGNQQMRSQHNKKPNNQRRRTGV